MHAICGPKTFTIIQYFFLFFSVGSNSVQTECPAGTKCVDDYFCDENAIMVNYRVDLTPAQKRNRGNLLVSTVFGVRVCAIALCLRIEG